METETEAEGESEKQTLRADSQQCLPAALSPSPESQRTGAARSPGRTSQSVTQGSQPGQPWFHILLALGDSRGIQSGRKQ